MAGTDGVGTAATEDGADERTEVPSPWRAVARAWGSGERRSLAAAAAGVLATLALAAALAFQAADAARLHRATADEALGAYTGIAAWEFRQRLTMALSSAALDLFVPAGAEPGIAPAALADSIRARMRWCGCVDSLRTVARLDGASATPLTAGAPLAPAVADTLRRVLAGWAALAPAAPPVGGVYVAVGPSGMLASRAAAAPPPPPPGAARELAFRFVPAGGEELLVVVMGEPGRGGTGFAVVLPAASFLAPVARSATGRVPLLPERLTGAVPPDSVLVARLLSPAGGVLSGPDPAPPLRFAAREALGGPFGGLALEVGLRAGVAGGLVRGGVPGSRAPLLAALVGTAGLLAALVGVQIRRVAALGRLRADFVAGVSHELRTPLAQIRLFAELLQDETLRSDEERRRWARVIDREALRLSHLVDNVLAFSRAERGAFRLVPERFELADEVAETLHSFAPLARGRGVAVRSTVPAGLAVRADRAAFRQMLLNLLDNAVRFGPAGQTVEVGAARDGARAAVWVDDEGPGIEPGEQGRVWEPYARGRGPEAAAQGGSGVGLAIVRTLAGLNGGRTWIGRAPAGGARVGVALPADD